jgi:hypothetical protein
MKKRRIDMLDKHTRLGLGLAALGLASAAILAMVVAERSAQAQAEPPPPLPPLPPPPGRFVSSLDLKCYRTPGPPLNKTLILKHLNPVLAHLPNHYVVMGEREQTCVPVAKNNVIPPPDVLPFVRYTDLACYKVKGPSVNVPLTLTHLNPVLKQMGVPVQNVVMRAPEQLCVPVRKNNAYIPPAVLALIRHIDLECYALDWQPPLNRALTLKHLNPLLTNMSDEHVYVRTPKQLCVPVMKNNQVPPAQILNIVRWLDLEKYDITAAPVLPVPLTLSHLNPLLASLPPENVVLEIPDQLGLPVAKNNQFPPSSH